jgi:energy-coupling factor transporter ATP-binding protein EcfA2
MSTSTNALNEIVKWSGGRPDWQRDALRRIVLKQTLEIPDIDELEGLCRQAHHAELDGAPQYSVNPLTAVDIAGPGSGNTATVLISAGNPKHVNRLVSTGNIVFGSSPGLTVIYGDNGAGKSGYARVIKKACRARGAAQDVLPDAFAKGPKGTPSMDLEFSVGGAHHKVTWQEGASVDARLSRIFVFDAASANHYLDQDSAAAFTPFGLDILPKLAKAADALNQRITKEESQLKASNAVDLGGALKPPPWGGGTAVARFLQGMSSSTKPEALTALATLSEAEKQRLKDLRDALAADPMKASKESVAAGERLAAFARKLETSIAHLGDSEIQGCRKLVATAKAAQELADAFASKGFQGSHLNGAGGPNWRAMWLAAREYSRAEAYPDLPFPVTQTGASCVLCQEPVTTGSGKRLEEFERTVSDKSQEEASEALAACERVKNAIEGLTSLTTEAASIEADLLELSDLEREQLGKTIRFLENRRAVASAVFSGGVEPETVPVSGGDPVAAIDAAAARLEARAKIEAEASDPTKRKQLTSERDELAAKEWLAPNLQIALTHVARLSRLHLLTACKKDLNTATITSKNTELTQFFITKTYRDRFSDELLNLELRTLDVFLEDIGGTKGETRFGLRLGKNRSESPSLIASEGERRCISLAAFLAELSQTDDKSTLVFDDPVSSLDYRYREAIAQRLASEARMRQVIVFTHDVCFLEELRSGAEALGFDPTFLWLEWDGDAPGKCMQGVPWDQMGPPERLDDLDKRRAHLSKTWSPVPSDINKREMRDAYTLLRAALERIVERELLGDVVARYRSQIKTGHLKRLKGIAAGDVTEAERLLQRCHEVTGAHDPSTKSQSTIPTPADLAADLQATLALLASIKAHQKGPAAVPPAVVAATT